MATVQFHEDTPVDVSMQRAHAPEKDNNYPQEEDDGVNPTLGLVRSMSMSTDKEILKQLRDAMNPKQKQQTVIMLFQASMALLAICILVGIVIVGYISLHDVQVSVSKMADQTEELYLITTNVSEQMTDLNENLQPVTVLPDFKQSLSDMNDNVYKLTQTLCASPLFAAQCVVPTTTTTNSTTG